MYRPRPIDTTAVELPPEVRLLTERLAEHAHDVWAERRIAEGWVHGRQHDDARKTHPSLVPYGQLPESERELDRAAALGTLKAIVALGYRIVPPAAAAE